MKTEKVEKLVAKLQEKRIKKDRKKHVIQIRNRKQASNHGLVLKKIQKVTKFNNITWLKS